MPEMSKQLKTDKILQKPASCIYKKSPRNII